MTVAECLHNVDYKKVLYYFTEISKIPRGSGNVKQISDYLVAFAKENNIRYIQDEAYNVIFFKPATAGYEDAPAVILQGHMDMVCEKESCSNHDFTKDALELLIEDGYLKANNTTLGGDDGIAVAFGMALLTDPNAVHPALEIVITTDEETGMGGAVALDTSVLSGKYMINLDSEEEGVVLVSCAGGMRMDATLPLKRIPAAGEKVTVCVKGLAGGHSGAEIHKNRSNATVLLGRILFEARNKADYFLVHMEGGLKDNAIPREAMAVLITDKKDALLEVLTQLEKSLKKELSASEPDFAMEISVETSEEEAAIHPVAFEKLLFMLVHTPNGVQCMSSEIAGLVESSLNLGIFTTAPQEAQFHYSLRSSVSSYKYFMRDKLEYLVCFLGGECSTHGEYPAWEYKKESKLREIFAQVFKQEYGKEAKMEAIHAGLECGLISEKMPGLDIVSIGPEMHDIHTPKERLSVESTIRVYKFLEKLLEALK